MRKNVNTIELQGRIYDIELNSKTVENQSSKNFGKEFINGTLHVAVDEAGMNVIPVHFTYVTAYTNAGKSNATFPALTKIMNEGKSIVSCGKDNAQMVKVSASFAVNDFYTQEDELVSAKQVEGSFVTLISALPADEKERNRFKLDVLLNNATVKEPDVDKGETDPVMNLHGVAFNFRNAILPIDLPVKDNMGISYFENLNISSSNPVYTQVWGNINCITRVDKHIEESGFGEDSVRTVERKIREWIVTGVRKEAYDYGDEEVLTSEEVQKAVQDRETYLAEVKKRRDEWQASKKTASPAQTAVVKNSNFDF